MRKINEIIVHCTATPAGRRVTAAEVDRWHRQRGFNGIGYHYLVGIDGSVEKGRPVEVAGAHCQGHNMASIGVAYAGGLNSQGRPADTRTPEQRRALRELITALRKRFPQARVRGHRDFAAKACPCFDATAEYASL
ncbi:MAG: N-acetylmuramoyl-L-alanine amidase [Muribaculaceae bacterium]|nr:N-acetylmuramoyl-L-alanine amidase [Muribaculaceae bacterium]